MPLEKQSFTTSWYEKFQAQLDKFTIKPRVPSIADALKAGNQWKGQPFVKTEALTAWLVEKDTKNTCFLDILLEQVYSYRAVPSYPRKHEVADGDLKCLITFCILLELGYGKWLQNFQSANIVDDHLPMTLNTLQERIEQALEGMRFTLEELRTIAKEFDEKQWKYRAMKMDLTMPDLASPRILPIFERKLITDKGGFSVVYQVAVPEIFVSPRLQLRVGSKPSLESKEVGRCYRFALKVFAGCNKKVFKDEVEAYRVIMLKNKGMLTYLGDYTFRNGNETSHTIVLEYAEGDLSEYFLRSSPVLPDQIIQFWNDIADVPSTLKDLHEFKVKTLGKDQIYEGWHADIKSDNILRAGGKFKLADPGFAKFQRRREIPEISASEDLFTGGTTSYAAPERSHPMNTKLDNPRACDIWSLGCVLSIAATWVILGRPGIRQYRDLRLNASAAQLQPAPSNPNFSGTRIIKTDRFHNGVEALAEIRQWHDFLRTTCRPIDTYTIKVLKLIEDHLLLADPRGRFKAADVCEWFEINIPPTSPPEALSIGNSAIRTAISFAQDQEANTIQSHLDDQTYDGRKDFKEADSYLPLPVPPASSKSVASKSINPLGKRESLSTQDEIKKAQAYQQTSIPPLAHTKRDRYCLFHAHYTHRNSKLSNEQDEVKTRRARLLAKIPGMSSYQKDSKLASFLQNRDLVFLVDNGSTMREHWYETMFLVETLYNKCRNIDDNGVDLFFTSPSSAIVKKAKGDDGLKQFLNTLWEERPKAEFPVQTNMRDPLEKLLQDWLSEYVGRLAEARKPVKMYTGGHKDLTIIVVTDGIWTAHKQNPADVDDAIVKFSGDYREAAGMLKRPKRIVSVQFVSLGDDPVALSRLTRLDDDLGARGVDDIVDHEPSDGDVYKMLAGSVIPEIDDMSTRPNRRSLTLPTVDPQQATPRFVHQTNGPRAASRNSGTENGRPVNVIPSSEHRLRVPSISLTPDS